MDPEIRKKLAKWLDKLDSHSIYTVEMLKDLSEFGIEYDQANSKISCDGKVVNLSVQTVEDVEREMKVDPRGGWLKQGVNREALMISGFELARDLCWLLLDQDPGAMFYGRGKAFQARVEALEK